MTPPPASSKERLDLHALTSLRFFAAFHVVLFHTQGLIGDARPLWLIELASGGHHAVALFFVLSGFILHHTYRLTDWKRPGEARQYFVNRIARIYPVYLLGFLVDAPRVFGYFLGTYDTATGLFKAVVSGTAYLSLTQTWVPRLSSAWNPPGWSLSNEAFFYLLLPWMLPFVARLAPRRAVAGLALAMAGASVGHAGGRLAVDAFGMSPEVWIHFLGFFPPLRFFEFAFGVLLGRLFSIAHTGPPIPPALGGWTTAFAAFAILGLSNPFTLAFVGRHPGLLLPFYGLLIVSLTQDSNPVVRILSARPLRFLGGASYAIYLLHMPLFARFESLASRLGASGSPGLFAVYLGLVLVGAAVVFRFYEEPLRRAIRGRFARPAASTRSASSSAG